MAYALLGDEIWSDPIMTALSSDAWRLHWCAVSYSSNKLTDGLMERRQVEQVAGINRLRSPGRLLDELVRSGLWKKVKGGYEILGFLDHNPTREKVLARRRQNAERQEKFRKQRMGQLVVIDPEEESGAASQ